MVVPPFALVLGHVVNVLQLFIGERFGPIYKIRLGTPPPVDIEKKQVTLGLLYVKL